MREPNSQVFLDEAFERIEETILPCITLLLERLIDTAAGIGKSDPKALADELRTVAAELDGLTKAVERASPALHDGDDARVATG
ncbi:hypothetical protein [Sphingomonas sp.]|uniref:hypothetical protein n=1 Tax=Sphingomonas sp. TaxID=28214 RepID=UPI00286BFD0F|nr:hypothetical protein [Sphingomonas sp.]